VPKAILTPAFTAFFSDGPWEYPLLEIEGQGYLPESHAIIWYLAEGSRLIPSDRLERARVWQWLCFEQYNLEPNVATVRFWLHSLKKTPEELGDRLTEKVEKGYQALAVLDQALKGKHFLVGEAYSIADIGLYAYTHVAEEGGFSLEKYPNIRAWLKRVASQPGYAPITEA
jgi:glutathione S-transferase